MKPPTLQAVGAKTAEPNSLADLPLRDPALLPVGDKAYFVHSLRLLQTNICYVGCTFYGFQRRFGEEGVWDYDLPQVWEYVDRFWHPELT